MDQNRTELEKKIVAAGSPEEIERILNDAGEKITAEEAQQLFEKVKSRAADKEVSLDELDAVSGGYNRNWILEGCAATVECRSWCWVNGSWCWSNDACSSYEVVYSRGPDKDYCCPICGAVATPVHRDYDPLPAGFNWGLFCRNHGYILHRYYDDKDIQFGFTL